MLRTGKISLFITILIILILVGSNIFLSVLAYSTNQIKGCEKGPSYTYVVPMEKITRIVNLNVPKLWNP